MQERARFRYCLFTAVSSALTALPEGVTSANTFGYTGPGSFTEVSAILPLLVDPESSEHPAFHVVAPSLPGFGFSDAPKRAGFSMVQYAEVRLWKTAGFGVESSSHVLSSSRPVDLPQADACSWIRGIRYVTADLPLLSSVEACSSMQCHKAAIGDPW